MANTQAPPTESGDWRVWGRQLAVAINAILRGKLNCVTTLTLTESVATTTITDNRIGPDTALILVPTTANAAAEIGNGTCWQTYPNSTLGQAVLNHANNAQTDREFVVAFIG